MLNDQEVRQFISNHEADYQRFANMVAANRGKSLVKLLGPKEYARLYAICDVVDFLRELFLPEEELVVFPNFLPGEERTLATIIHYFEDKQVPFLRKHVAMTSYALADRQEMNYRSEFYQEFAKILKNEPEPEAEPTTEEQIAATAYDHALTQRGILFARFNAGQIASVPTLAEVVEDEKRKLQAYYSVQANS